MAVLLLGGLAGALVWTLREPEPPPEAAMTDRIIALSAPDFTRVYAGQSGNPASVEPVDRRERRRPRGVALGHPHRVEGAIAPNQSLFIAMRGADVESASIQEVVDALDGTFDFRRSRPGDQWEAELDLDGQVNRFRYVVSREEVYEAVREPEGHFRSGRVDVPLQTIPTPLGGTIQTTVYDAVIQAGEGTALAASFMALFHFDIDFSRQARPGDTYRLVVEKVFLDGEFLRYGRILAAEYVGQELTLRIFSHTGDDGTTEYYTESGEAVRRAFLQTPLTYRRISSTFTLRRYHPVLQTYRPHLGVDYAAPTGTPIWSIAAGRVTFAAERGGNGNLVVVNHGQGYESMYAHLSRFGPGIRRGSEVEQGDVIGYVGSTGLSTGPHLHFGMKHRGEYVDPFSVQSERGPSLRGAELRTFQSRVEMLAGQLSAITITPIELTHVPVAREQLEDLPGDFGMLDHDQEDAGE